MKIQSFRSWGFLIFVLISVFGLGAAVGVVTAPTMTTPEYVVGWIPSHITVENPYTGDTIQAPGACLLIEDAIMLYDACPECFDFDLEDEITTVPPVEELIPDGGMRL